MKASDLAAVAAPAEIEPVPALPAGPGAAPAAEPTVLAPDSDGVIDVAAADRRREAGLPPNPFRLRYRPPVPPREVSLEIGGVVAPSGPKDACVVVNGLLYQAGDPLEGMTIASITGEALELRRDRMLLRVPIQDRPVVLRLPR